MSRDRIYNRNDSFKYITTFKNRGLPSALTIKDKNIHGNY